MPFWRKSSEDTPPPRHLPLPTGPHAVGYQDVMTPGPADEGLTLYFLTLLILTLFRSLRSILLP